MVRLFRDQDFLLGLVFILFGTGYFALSYNLEFGTPRRMGPGFFPGILTAILVAVGLVLSFRAMRKPGEPVEGISLKGAFFIGAAVISFGLLLRGAGLVAAVSSVILISSLASNKTRPVAIVLFAIGASAFCVLVFVKGLGVPLPVIGSWYPGG